MVSIVAGEPDSSSPGRIASLVEKRSGACFRLVKCTTNAPRCRAATGGTRHGQGYQGRAAGACAPTVVFGLVASGQIKLRKIDGGQKIGAVLNQHTAVTA